MLYILIIYWIICLIFKYWLYKKFIRVLFKFYKIDREKINVLNLNLYLDYYIIVL